MRFTILSKLTSTSSNRFSLCCRRNLKYSSKDKITHPSADRNSQPIAEALRSQVDSSTPGLRLLEIASGSGQHVGYLAPLFPNITFQPTECDAGHFPSINAYAIDCRTQNIQQPPLFVDISKGIIENDLPPESFDYMLNCNMMHISPWKCSVGLFQAAGRLLKPKGLLFTYGPYAVNGVLTPASNVDFDRSLRSRNSEWGIRDIAQLKELAVGNGLDLKETLEMPANNKFLIWIKPQ